MRSMSDKDAAPYVEWLRDPDIAALLRARKVPSAKERAEQLRVLNSSSNDLVAGIEIKDTAKLIGTIGLRDINWRKGLAELAIFIGDKKEWNKGYGTEAMKLLIDIGFKKLGLEKIQLRVNPSNVRARHIFQKAGFKEKTADKEFIVMIKEPSHYQTHWS